jgi:hypothetical protein
VASLLYWGLSEKPPEKSAGSATHESAPRPAP